MTEVWFYHLQNQPLAKALPALIEKTLARGWKAVIQAGGEDRVAALDDLLWTWSDAAFLPHGRAGEGDAETQPVYLTAGLECPNGAQVRFFLDGTGPGSDEGVLAYQRCVVMFDGADPDALSAARAQWKTLKSAGHAVTYWQQNAGGQWEKKA